MWQKSGLCSRRLRWNFGARGVQKIVEGIGNSACHAIGPFRRAELVKVGFARHIADFDERSGNIEGAQDAESGGAKRIMIEVGRVGDAGDEFAG